MMGRSRCCSNERLNRGTWTEKEDMILSEYIQIHGDGRWKNVAQNAGLKRCAKSCRLRWLNYLRPDIKRGSISLDEEDLIVRLHRLLGNRWSLIAGRLPGRTDNEIKNYWNSHLCKKLPLRNQYQHKWKERNPESRSKDPSSSQNPVLKTTPIKTTIAEKHSEIVIPNGCSNSENSACGFKLCDIKKTANFSMSGCDLLMNDSITVDHFEPLASEMTGPNVVEEAVTNSGFSIATLRVENPPHSDHLAGVTAALPESLFDMNELSYPDWNMFWSTVTCSAALELEEFYREAAVETNELEI